MTLSADIGAIRACLKNSLGPVTAKRICGVVGDSPSHYSKSPSIWNAVFDQMALDCAYFPLDVSEQCLPSLFTALRNSQSVLGVNVTVPYKNTVMNLLDSIDPIAACIQAVNTVVRTPEGKLVGYNTDGRGFLNSILNPPPGKRSPFIDSLEGMNILIIGAGGAARAVAFSLADLLKSGGLIISNRTVGAADVLSEELKSRLRNVHAITETDIGRWAPRCGLIVNCSLKGQGGIRTAHPKTISVLEPYSALAPANPAMFPEAAVNNVDFYPKWLAASQSDIESNHHASLNLVLSVPGETAFCDLIYFPSETVFLWHARLSGHKTLNGRGMIIAQAVEAFFKICAPLIEGRGAGEVDQRRRVAGIMESAW